MLFRSPLELLSFSVDYSIWGLNPFGYHLTNLFLHIINSTLVYIILSALSPLASIAFCVSLFFGISPTISGITYYISARSDLLMAMFVFLSLIFFIKYEQKGRKGFYALSIISFALALLSKEMAVILVMLLALHLSMRDRPLRRFKRLFPYVILLVFYIILRYSILNFAKGTNPVIDFNYPATISFSRRLLTDLKIIPKYVWLLLFPYGLHMEWFIKPARSIFQLDVMSSIAVIIIMMLALKRISGRRPLVLFGSLWFMLSLLPVFNIYPISVFFGEGWLYVPAVGFFIIFSVFLIQVIGPRIGKQAVIIIAALLVIYYSLFNISYGRVWKDSISLLSNVLRYERKSPLIYLTYNNLGMAYYDKGELEKSIEYYKKSVRLNPRYAEAYNNLGVSYMGEGRPVEAIRYFKKAISLKRDYISAYSNLSHAYNNLGLSDRAMQFSILTIKLDPACYKGYRDMGYIYSKKGDIDKAIRSFRKALELKKGDFEVHYCLGALYAKKSQFKRSLYEYQNAIRFGAGDYKFYNELAYIYLKNNMIAESERALIRSIALNKDQSEPYNNLGNIYSMCGYFKMAIKEYKKALEKDPDNPGIRGNLQKTRMEWKDRLSQS